jgi:hypothetical protein
MREWITRLLFGPGWQLTRQWIPDKCGECGRTLSYMPDAFCYRCEVRDA